MGSQNLNRLWVMWKFVAKKKKTTIFWFKRNRHKFTIVTLYFWIIKPLKKQAENK